MTDRVTQPSQDPPAPANPRRFLGAGVAAAGAVALAACGKKEEPAKAAATPAPAVAAAPAPVVLKLQGAWGAKDIFNEMAQEYVTRVNEMAGGRPKIDTWSPARWSSRSR